MMMNSMQQMQNMHNQNFQPNSGVNPFGVYMGNMANQFTQGNQAQ